MRCYEVTCHDAFESGGSSAHDAYFATLEQAKRVARTAAKETGNIAEVSRVVVRDGKVGMLAALNGIGWCIERKIVYVKKPSKMDNNSDD